jgi:hypothetical protein
VTVSFVLGHDTHGHGETSTTGCTGTLPTPADGADHAGGYLYGGISATYTDLGGGGQPVLTTVGQTTIQVRRQQAEFAQVKQGVTVATTNDVGAGQHLTGIDNGDHIAFDPINLGDADSITFRYAGGSATTVGTPRANVEVRVGAPDGPLVTTATLNATAGTSAWASQSVPVDYPAGTQKLYLVFKPVTGGPTSGFFNLNWVEFGTTTP